MASKRRIRRKQCEGKKRYVLEKDANIIRYRMYQQGENNLNVYRCKFCNGFHIGHTPGWLKKKIIAKDKP